MSRKIDIQTEDLSQAIVDKWAFEDKPNSPINTLKSALFCEDPSRTVHSVADDTDINRMVTGATPFTLDRRPSFFIDETVFPETLEQHVDNMNRAWDAFMELPAKTREAFDNDPVKLAQALGDPSQVDRLRELGVIPTPDPVPEPEPGVAPKRPHKAGVGDTPPAPAPEPDQGGTP